MALVASQALTSDSDRGVVIAEGDNVQSFRDSPVDTEKDGVRISTWPRPALSHRRDSSTGTDSTQEACSLDSLSLTDSPDVTTISTASQLSSRSSLTGYSHKDSQHAVSRPKHSRQRAYGIVAPSLFSGEGNNKKTEYHALKDRLHKYSARQGAAKANYLRMTLLPFLRKDEVKPLRNDAEARFATTVLANWWDKLLADLNNSQSVAGSDRSAICEAISGILARPEWSQMHLERTYQLLLQRTVVTVGKQGLLPQLSVSQAAFLGKVLGYAYFYLPGMAGYFISLLKPTKDSIQRLKSVAGDIQSSVHRLIDVPMHLAPLIGLESLQHLPTKPTWITDAAEEGWCRHLHIDSVLFASFLKHISALQALLFPGPPEPGTGFAADELYQDADSLLLVAPGMFLVLSAIVTHLDAVMRDTTRTLGPRNANPYNLRPQRPPQYSGPGPERVRIDQLKVLMAIRELIHNDEKASRHFFVFSRAFNHVFQAVSIGTNVYDVEGCVTVCDLAEEWISSVHQVTSSRPELALLVSQFETMDWLFWLNIAQRMLGTNICNSEIRALSFLFNIWPHLPGDSFSGSGNRNVLRISTDWLLSPGVWRQLFCHWNPLVRSYYHRLICYRVASVGVEARLWFLDVMTAQYIEDSRKILAERLVSTARICRDLREGSPVNVPTAPSLPMPRLQIAIRLNGAAQASSANSQMPMGPRRLYPFDIFDSAAYWQYDSKSASEQRASLQRSSSVSSKASVETVSSSRSVESFMSIASGASVASGISVASGTSNASLQSHSTVNSQWSRTSRVSISRLSLAIKPRATGKEAAGTSESVNEEDKHLNSDLTTSSISAAQLQSKKRWLFFWNLIPALRSKKSGKSTASNVSIPDDAEESFTGSSLAQQNGQVSPGLSIQGKEKPRDRERKARRDRTPSTRKGRGTSSSRRVTAPPPASLTQPLSEVVRPPHRFVLVPADSRAQARRGDLTVPRLPFSKEFDLNAVESSVVDQLQSERALPTYGGRSLAEWNIEVSNFERYVESQRDEVNGSVESLQMPFMVAEIPWRFLG